MSLMSMLAELTRLQTKEDGQYYYSVHERFPPGNTGTVCIDSLAAQVKIQAGKDGEGKQKEALPLSGHLIRSVQQGLVIAEQAMFPTCSVRYSDEGERLIFRTDHSSDWDQREISVHVGQNGDIFVERIGSNGIVVNKHEAEFLRTVLTLVDAIRNREQH